MKKYNEQELENLLKDKNLTWINKNLDYIKAKFVFKDFKTAIDFVNKVADISEDINHHPDIKIKYNQVTLKVFTHSENAITELDIKLADLVDNIYKEYS